MATRTKVWKCSIEQCRPAIRVESLGAELLDESCSRIEALQERLDEARRATEERVSLSKRGHDEELKQANAAVVAMGKQLEAKDKRLKES